jgi:diguanylate cyclase (GGDEF)-like protein
MIERFQPLAVCDGGSPAATEDDTNKLIAQTAKLAQLNSWFEIALNNMARGLSMFDADRRLIVCNAVYRELYELPEDLTRPGTHIADLVSYHALKEGGRNTPEEKETQRRWIEWHVSELKRGKTFTHTQRLRNGRIILVTNQPLADGGWVDIQEDVTDKTEAAERISWLANHCSLTETANRFHIRELLNEELQKATGDTRVAVHLIDLDRFKQVNDTHGHAAGDALLTAVAKRMRSTIRDNDLIGRLGGDEFVVIQPGVAHVSQAETLARRLMRVLNSPYRVLGNTANAGASIGVALSGDASDDADSMLRKADIALYRVKSTGRGSFNFYRQEDEKVALERMQLESDMRYAVLEDQLELHYQPIVNLRTREVAGCEALMRWRHPKIGLIAPLEFIPMAEKNGLIVEMGAWAIKRACSDAARWRRPIKVTVNLSPVQFESGDPSEIVAAALENSGLPPERLELEITETVLLRSESRIKDILHKLRDTGVRIALDDFGTAFASLSYLRNFSFDRIKIDRSFVAEMADRQDCMAIVTAVAGLAKALDIGSVAEGIETVEQLAQITSAGCNEVQGYYFSPPVPFANIEQALDQCEAKLARRL